VAAVDLQPVHPTQVGPVSDVAADLDVRRLQLVTVLLARFDADMVKLATDFQAVLQGVSVIEIAEPVGAPRRGSPPAYALIRGSRSPTDLTPDS
jgi:hypothetical protein